MKIVLAGLLLAVAPLFGQDAAGIATQTAMDQAQMANQQAMDQAQMANQQAMDQAQMASQQAANSTWDTETGMPLTREPVLSVKSGPVKAGTTVRIKSPTHYAAIYYTTNGWTPTQESRRYKGPITIRTDTVLQVIAVAPGMAPSMIKRAEYRVAGVPPETMPQAIEVDGILRAGTRIHLVTAQEVNSKSADVGDRIRLKLDQDIKLNGRVIAAKGTPVEATITQADAAAHAGEPGDIAFEVDSIRVGEIKVPLSGGETLEGPSHLTRTTALFLIPGAGVAGLLLKGDEAMIKPGMTLTASVTQDTPLQE